MNQASFINHLQEPNMFHISYDQYNDLSSQLYITLSIDYLYEFNTAIKYTTGEIMSYSKKHKHHQHHHHHNNDDNNKMVKKVIVLNNSSKDYLENNDSNTIHHDVDDINDGNNNSDSDNRNLLLSEMKLLMLYYTRSINKHKFLEDMSTLLNNDVYLIEQLLHAINSIDTSSLTIIASSSTSPLCSLMVSMVLYKHHTHHYHHQQSHHPFIIFFIRPHKLSSYLILSFTIQPILPLVLAIE